MKVANTKELGVACSIFTIIVSGTMGVCSRLNSLEYV